MKTLRTLLRSLAAAALLMLITATAFAQGDLAVIAPKGAKVFAKPGLTGKSVSLDGYTILKLKKVDGGVATVVYKGIDCYIKTKKITELDSDDTQVRYVLKKTPVYKTPSSKNSSFTLKKDTQVELLATYGKAALIGLDGKYGYVKKAALTETAPVPDYIEERFEAVAIKDAAIFKKPNKTAKKLSSLKKDEHIWVTAYNETWAQVEYNSGKAYMKTAVLKKYVPPKPKPDDIFDSEKYSNEVKVFHYLHDIVGLSEAAVCGIMANIDCESGFRPDAFNGRDPNGGSYGICQWNGGRQNALKNYCAENGLDYTTLKGQCLYLNYELTNKYTSVYNYIKNVDDSAQGAYDAGYHWCYYYEVPANRSSVAVKRGNIAKNEYWPKYR